MEGCRRYLESAILADAARENQRDTRSVATGSPFREVLEQVNRSADADCGPQTMRRAFLTMKNGIWEDFMEEYRSEGIFASGLSK